MNDRYVIASLEAKLFTRNDKYEPSWVNNPNLAYVWDDLRKVAAVVQGDYFTGCIVRKLPPKVPREMLESGLEMVYNHGYVIRFDQRWNWHLARMMFEYTTQRPPKIMVLDPSQLAPLLNYIISKPPTDAESKKLYDLCYTNGSPARLACYFAEADRMFKGLHIELTSEFTGLTVKG